MFLSPSGFISAGEEQSFCDVQLVFAFSGDFATFHRLFTVVYPDYPEVETTEDYIEARFESLHMTVIAP